MPGSSSLSPSTTPHSGDAVLTLPSALPAGDLASPPLPPIHLISDGLLVAWIDTTITSLPIQPRNDVSLSLVTSVMLPFCLIVSLLPLSRSAASFRQSPSLLRSMPLIDT